MDNLTHSLLGVALSRAGLNRLAPHAGWLLVAAANAPDLDIIAWAGGNAAYLEHHRGWLHAAPMAPLVALLPWLAWRLLVRRGPGLGAYLCALAGVASHLLLDWLNVYGIRLLLPFSKEWFRLDLLYIVDLWVWVLLLAATLGPLLVKLVNAEIGARSGPGRGGAWFALALLVVYIFGRSMLHDRALETLATRSYPEGRVIRQAAFPGPFDPLRWTGVVETAPAWRVYDLHLAREFDPDDARLLYRSAPEPMVAAALRSPLMGEFARFNQFPYWRVTPVSEPEGGSEVSLFDLRFGLPEQGRFAATVVLDPQGKIVREAFEFGRLGTGKP